jgi:hypothetical protein
MSVFAYADDLVILAPTASAMRKLLSICDEYAINFDILFNASKSKCLLFHPAGCKRHCTPRPTFCIGNKEIEYVESWPHLGHVLCSSFSDCKDILNRRNSLVGQINEVLCCFGNLSPVIKTHLLYTYCSSLYGCELWDLSSQQLAAIGVCWRKAIKRCWNLPMGAHAHVLYALCGKWPIEDEIRRRILRFNVSCINSDVGVVRDVTRFNLCLRPAQSVVGRNLLFCCGYYKLAFKNVTSMSVEDVKQYTKFGDFYKLCSRNGQSLTIEHLSLLMECLFIRDGVFDIVIPGLDHAQLQDFLQTFVLNLCTR